MEEFFTVFCVYYTWRNRIFGDPIHFDKSFCTETEAQKYVNDKNADSLFKYFYVQERIFGKKA